MLKRIIFNLSDGECHTDSILPEKKKNKDNKKNNIPGLVTAKNKWTSDGYKAENGVYTCD